MNRIQIKKKVVDALAGRELKDVFFALKDIQIKLLVTPLFSCLCHAEPLIRWHAVSVFGWMVKQIAENNLEDGRVIMRRFLWMLNDESGGIGWGVPEAMGEVMSGYEPLANEYAHMLVSYTLDDGPELHQDGNFIELPFLQQGVLWGMCRLASMYPEKLLEHKVNENLLPYFYSEDTTVQGLVCCLADLLKISQYNKHAENLCDNMKQFRIYVDGIFYDITVGESASVLLGENQTAKNWFLRTAVAAL